MAKFPQGGGEQQQARTVGPDAPHWQSLQSQPMPTILPGGDGEEMETVGLASPAPVPTTTKAEPTPGEIAQDGEVAPKQAEPRPGMWERFVANYDDMQYKGTLGGSGMLANMRELAERGPPAPDAPDFEREAYDRATKWWTSAKADIAYSELIPPAEGPLEYTVAGLGQLAGGIMTPESALGIPYRAASVGGRLLTAGVEGAVINTITDPLVQMTNKRAGIRDEFDVWQTAFAPVTGFIGGVAIQGGFDLVRAGYRQTIGRITGKLREPAEPAAAPEPSAAAPTRAGAVDAALTETAPVGQARPGASLESEQTYRVRVRDLQTDPQSFQYKSGGDTEGVTTALKGIEAFDEAKAGRIIVFQRNDGELIVADGHQRTGLARRLIAAGKEPEDLEITALVYREADGYRPEDVRAIAAAANLATGTGSATDAAKVLRVRPDLVDGTLPPNSQLVRDAKGLAKLSDDAFGMVVNDVVPERYGALVGNNFNEPDMQTVAMRAIAKLEPQNADEAAILIERIKSAAVEKAASKAQGSLFDDMFNEAESTVGEEMRIVGRALRRLKSDATLFRGAVRKAERLEETGSKIERQASQQAADEAAKAAFLAEKSFDTAGPIRATLTELARQVKRGEVTMADAAQKFAAAVKGAEGEAPATEKPALVVARRAPDGTVHYGKPGQIHADLLIDEGISTDPKVAGEMGFAIPGGPFLTRKEAADYAGTKGNVVNQLAGGLEAAQYFRKPAPDLFGEPQAKVAALETPKPGSRQQLEALIANKAPADDILAHPIVREADRLQREQSPGPDIAAIEADATYRANRVFRFDGEEVIGYDAALPRLVEIARAFAEGPVANERRAVIVTGPPAAGKSTLAEGLARARKAAIVDSDEAKKVLPEFGGGLGSGVVHEESSYLNRLVMAEMIADGGNVVIPVVGAEPAKVRAHALVLQEAGYTVDLVNLQVDPDEAFRRMVARYLKTGRFITLDYFNSIGEKPLNGYRQHAKEGIFRETANIDNTVRYTFTDGSEKLAGEALASRPGRDRAGPVDDRGAGGAGEAQGARAGDSDGVADDFGAPKDRPQPLVTGLQGQQGRPAAGQPQQQGQPAVDVVALRGLVDRLSTALDLPALRQGHLMRGREGRTVQGQYDTRSGVTRLREIDDFVALAHETGHHIEQKWGADIRPILRQNVNRREVAALDYDPARGNLSEGFAEFFRLYVTAPQFAQTQAPSFFPAFDNWLRTTHPNVWIDLRAARDAYNTYLTAPSGAVIEAGLATSFEPTGIRGVFRRIKTDGLRNTIAATMSNFYTASIDERNPLHKAVRQLAAIHKANTGKVINLRAVDDPYKLARLSVDAYNAGHLDLMHGVHGYRSTDPEGPSLREAIIEATGKADMFGKWDKELLSKFNAYLVSRRALFEYGRYERGEIANPPTAETKGDHEINVAELEAQFPAFATAAGKVHEWTRNLLRKEFDAGLISKTQYDAALAITDYVPFMRDMSDRDPGAGTGGDKNLRQNIIRRFNGSSRPIIAPLESLMKRAYDTNILIVQNDVVKALDRLALAAGNGGGKIAERIPNSKMTRTQVDPVEAFRNAARDQGIDPVDADQMVKAITDLLGDDARASIFRLGEINDSGEPIVFFWEGGKRQALRLADGDFGRDIYQVLTGMPQLQRDMWINTVAKPAAVLRAGITTSPDFLIANYLRDQMSAFVLTEGYVPFWSGARGMVDEVAQRQMGRIYSLVGGIAGGSNVAALREARIDHDLNALARSGWLSTKLTSFSGIFKVAEASETGTRLGVFRTAFNRSKRDGLDDWEAAIEAAFYARDLIDFGRHGSRALAAMRMVPFFNAALQGLDKANRKLFAPAAKHLTDRVLTVEDQKELGDSMKAWAKLSALAILSMGLRALYWDDPDFDEGNEYIRATHWLLKVPGHDKIIRIPKPFELAIPMNFAERMFEYFALNDPTAIAKFARSVTEVTSPPNPLMTPLIKVPIEVVTNRNLQNVSLPGMLTGTAETRPIVPEHMKGLEPWLQYTHYTSELSRRMGEAVNVSPAILDHAIFGFTGSWGRGLAALFDQASDAKGERGWEDTFITRRFLYDVTRGSSSTTRFWEQVGKQTGELERKSLSYKAMIDQGRLAEAADHLSKLSDEERVYVALNRSDFDADTKRLHPLRRARDAAEVLSAMRRDIAFGNLRGISDNEPIDVTRSQRRTLDNALAHIGMVEARNALIATGEKGWKQRPIMDVGPSYDVVEAINPAVAAELRSRYATARVHTFAAVQRNWAEVQKRVLSDGSEAELSDLKADVKTDGYELGETRQRRAKQVYPVPGRAGAAR